MLSWKKPDSKGSIVFVSNYMTSRIDKTIGTENWWPLPGLGGREGLTTKTVLGDFRGNDATVVYPDCDGNYITVCICQSS